MPIDFPSNPQIDELYSAEDRTWRWTGVYWRAVSTTIGYTGSQGEQGEGFRILGSFPTVADLPNDSSGQPGDAYVITETGDLYSWDGFNWNNIGRFVGYTGSKGFTGSQGPAGNFGGVTLDYTFSSNTDSSQDPGVGKIKFNDVSIPSSTLMYIGDSDDDNINLDNYLATIDASTSGIRGHFRITRKLYPDQFVIFAITDASIDQGSYFIVNCAYVSGNLSDSSTAFDDGDDILITFARTGDKGDIGYTGSQGFTGSQGATGTSIRIVGALATSSLLPFPHSGDIGDGYLIEDTGNLWLWDGNQWNDIGKLTGDVGPTGFTGSQGDVGYTGSEGESTFTWGPTPPENPAVGDRWFDTIVGAVAVYVDDGDTQAWLEVAGSGFMGQTGYTGSGGGGGPRVSSIDYPGDATAADPAGGETVGIVGSGFQSGAHILLDNTAVGQVSFVSENRLEIVTPAKSVGTYNYLYIINPDGATAIYVPGLQYSGSPTWSSPGAGSLSSVYETQSISQSFSASSDSSVTYSLLSGTLPAGSSLDPATGTLTGTASNVDNATTYTFTIRATDAESQTSDRQFSLTVDPDVITWNFPINGAVVEFSQDSVSSIPLSATAATGATLSYTTSSLPDGLTLSGNTISGTATTLGDIPATATAYAASSDTTAVISVTWRVVLGGDQFFNQTSLLLNGDVNTFITDASDNNFTITPVADTRPSAFSPYNTSWSNYFDGTVSSDYLSTPSSDNFAFGVGDFTVEGWIYASAAVSISGERGWFQLSTAVGGVTTDYVGGIVLGLRSTGGFYFIVNNNTNWFGTPALNRWYHIACARENGTVRCFVDGTLAGSYQETGSITGTYVSVGGYYNSSYFWGGYVSNVRVVKGRAVYTSNFTLSSSPLGATSGGQNPPQGTETSLLTCQSNRFIDNSTGELSITRNGTPKVTNFAPFTDTDTSTGSGYFDGTDGYLSVPSSANLQLGSGDFTAEMFIYISGDQIAPGGYGYGLFGTYDGGSNGGWSLNVNRIIGANYGLFFILSNSIILSDTSGLLPKSQWHHIAIVREGSGSNNLSLFLNGTRVAQTTNTTNDTVSSTCWIGTAGGSASTFQGYISNARFVKGTALYSGATYTVPTSPLTAVSDTQLLTLQTRTGYNNSQPIDESGIKNVITRPTGTNASVGSYSPYVPTGWSGYFNGSTLFGHPTNAYAIWCGGTDTGFAGKTWTIETWLYLTTWTNNAQNTTIIGSYQGVAANGRWVFSVITANNSTNSARLNFTYTNSTSTEINIQSSDDSIGKINKNEWAHVAVTIDATTSSSSTIKFYVNGILSATHTNQNLSTHTDFYDQPYIGGGVAFYNSMFGYISNFRIKRGEILTFGSTPTEPAQPDTNTVYLNFRSNNFYDESASRTAVTPNAVQITPFSPFKPHTVAPDSYSVYFDGSSYFTSSTSLFNYTIANASAETFTIEALVYHTVRTTPSQIYYSQSIAGKGDVYLNLGINGSGNLIFYHYDGTPRSFTGSSVIPLNTWTHVAVVVSGGTATIYVNGISDGSGTWYGIQAGGQNSTSYFGRPATNASAQYFNGYISNLRVSNNARSISVPTTPYANDEDTVFLTEQSSTIVDNSSNAFTITVNGNSQPSKFNPFGETVTSGVEYSPSSHGGSVYFDGTGDHLTLPTGADFVLGTSDFTIDCWVYLVSLSAERAIFYKYVTWTSNVDIALRVNANGSVRFLAGDNIPIDMTSATGLIKIYNWHHIAVTRSGTAFKLFIDGIQVQTDTDSTSIANDKTTMHIGSDTNGTNSPFYGYISGLRIVKGTALYNSAFLPPQAPAEPIPGTILLTCNNHAAIQDKSGRNVLETVGNTRTLPESPYRLNKSVFFDGTGGGLSVNSTSSQFSFSGDFTWEAWISFNALPAIGAAFSILMSRDQTVATSAFQFYIYNDSGSYSVAGTISVGSTDSNLSFAIPNAPVVNTWYHVALVRNSNSIQAYWNGSAIGSPSTVIGTTNAPTQLPGIGFRPLYNDLYFNGYISNLRMADSAVYTEDFDDNLPTSPLTAITGTRLLTCQSYNFKDNSTNDFTITPNGNAKITSRGPFTETQTSDYAMSFDGSGGRCLIVPPANPNFFFATGNFTIEMWVYHITLKNYSGLIGEVPGTTNNTINLYTYADGKFGVTVLSTNEQMQTAAGTAVAGAWQHVALVRNNNLVTLYVDGISRATYPSSASMSVGGSTGASIGSTQGTGDFNGYINDLRITKGVARYDEDFPPPSSAYLAR